MTGPVRVAEVILWGRQIGAVAWNEALGAASFEYTPEFRTSGVEPSPLMMPSNSTVYTFPALARETYRGLPGMLADALPDRFGNLLIDQWLVKQGRDPASFSPIERLCYMGTRAMGALEFRPALSTGRNSSVSVEIESLVRLASEALQSKASLNATIARRDDVANESAMNEIIRVGTSAGGARAKVVIAWNPNTNEICSGQVEAPDGFEHWLLKLDGVRGNRDRELSDPQGYGRIEYAYYLMATEAGIEMSECRLLHENDRSHFMTRRFDRTNSGTKLHVQTLCAIAHFDFNKAGAYSYEQALQTMLQLELPRGDLEQQFRRMVFNVVARNQDDHTKNISFLMNKQGEWSLSTAYDVVYSYNPSGAWTSSHQMSINGKRDDLSRDDLLAVAKRFNISHSIARRAIEEVDAAVTRWPEFAQVANVPKKLARRISEHHRLNLR